ncbi:ral guanine nucleotide dissociation stimulator-like isoform X4 [Dasypus novemcinctus]|uniref:ral guanine nucleotide dissociation stimulator-like isoform X4 n=1 Tax=Dasypus novemcinctus TaxID=9361 RepID=UPI00265EC4C5|nr:ral guanine nucleotide dissociation stimulator-like isoform X4 [Dasypus novemcinctus]
MFSCCVPNSRGSSLNQTRNESFSHCFRNWLRPQPQGFWSSSRRSPKSSMQVGSEELEDGLIYSVSLQKMQASHGPSKSQRWFQRKNNSTLMREENPVVRTVKAGHWEKLVEHLVPAFQEGDLMYVNIFLGTYRVFTTTKQVLDCLFHRYGCKCCSSGEHAICLEIKNTLSSLLGTWLDKYPEDFIQPAASPCLKLLVGYAQVHLPDSALEYYTEILLSQMSHPEPTEADPKAHLSAPELQMPPEQTMAPIPPSAADTGEIPKADLAPSPPPPLPMEVAHITTLKVEPAPSPDGAPAARLEEVTSPSAAQLPELEAISPLPPVPPTPSAPVSILEAQPISSPSPVPPAKGKACLAEPPEPLPELKSAAGQVTPSEPSSSCPETSENLPSEEKANLLAFPPELVAQQLTMMDAELFKKVVPYHCLGATWSQHNRKGQEHVAPTVCAVITQFNHVTNCVITTCLGDQSMKAQDRARVVEHWIEVARECQILKNFSSLCAILSALESQSIHRLKKTWEEVSRDSFHLFQMLSEIVSNENNLSQSCEFITKEEVSKFSTLEVKPERTQKKEQQGEMGVIEGVVPCLGTFLTQFLMVDNAMQEYLEGRMVNFEKRRKEYQMIVELQQLQAGCCYDSLMPSEKFGAWFGDMKQLSKKESYHLSCELEPPSQLASKNFQDKHDLEGIKPWSEDCQAPDTESSGNSNPYSSFQLQCGPVFSSGDAADSPHTHEAGSSSSKVNIHLDHVLESQDDHEMKLGQSTSESTRNSVVTSASRKTSSSSSSIKRWVRWFIPRRRNPQPRYKWHVIDYCIVRVSLEEDNGQHYKSIKVSNQEMAPAVIHKAMEELNMDGENPEDYKLVQIISEDQMLQIPDSAKVYYAMHPSPKYELMLMKRTSPMDTKLKKSAISAFLGKKLKGPKF